METIEQRQLAEFFARLVNIENLRKLPPPEKVALQNEYNDKFVRLSRVLEVLRSPLSDDQKAEAEVDEKAIAQTIKYWKDALPRMLADTHRKAKCTIQGLLNGDRVVLSTEHIEGQLRGRVVEEKGRAPLEQWMSSGYRYPRKYVYPLSADLHSLVRLQPFPFGRCAREGCRKIFVQPARGKPRRYCSATCRLQSSPAVARHTEYVRELRQKRRKTELATTRAILRQWPEHEGCLRELGKKFPKKSKRQLLYLIKQARGELKIKRKETA